MKHDGDAEQAAVTLGEGKSEIERVDKEYNMEMAKRRPTQKFPVAT